MTSSSSPRAHLDTAGGRGNGGIYFRCQPHLDRKQEYPPAMKPSATMETRTTTRAASGQPRRVAGSRARSPA